MTGRATARPKSADPEWVAEILDCLEQGKSVRRDLPGGGRVHIDRPLPFLCLHATGDGHQIAALDVATANASYLLAPEVRPPRRSLIASAERCCGSSARSWSSKSLNSTRTGCCRRTVRTSLHSKWS